MNLKFIVNILSNPANFFKKKTPVIILSSMRSGSTLLKSLLSNAFDTSHLPEVDFQIYRGRRAWRYRFLSNARIIIMKRPAKYYEDQYPLLPEIVNTKKIILVRDVYETTLSLQKMNSIINIKSAQELTYHKLVNEYWYSTYSHILSTVDIADTDTMLVRYEDLIDHPIQATKEIFSFIGSQNNFGVDSYKIPNNFVWEWGKDDGGEKINMLRVDRSSINTNYSNSELMNVILSSTKVLNLRFQLGYDSFDKSEHE